MSDYTIKVPNGVWQLIIDKIEPSEYKIPLFITIKNVTVPFNSITSISGPFDTQYPDLSRTKYLSVRYGKSNIAVNNSTQPKLYHKLVEIMNFYRID